MLCVIKRDGSEQAFDASKIVRAVEAAFKDVEGEVSNSAHKLADSIATIISQIPESLTIEQIQSRVEDLLMSSARKDVARAYIEYRYKHDLKRRENTTDKTIMEMLAGKSEYWNTENGNKNVKVMNVIRDYLAGITSKDLTRRLLLDEDIVKADEEGIIHFHDADYFLQNCHNCDLLNIEDMLQNGTCINGVYIDKPRTLRTAFNLASQIVAACSSCQYGGITITLSHLAPFVEESRKRYRERFSKVIDDENLLNEIVEQETNKEIKDSCQLLNYQLNTLYTSNGQAPFVSVCMYLGEVEDEHIKEDLAKLIYETLEQRIQGFKNEKGVWITPAFPKLLYFLDEENIYPNSKYYYLTLKAAECTSKRLVPDYVSVKKMKELKGGAVYPPMGCRSFLTPDRTTENYSKRLNWKGPKLSYYGRFNQGVVTINLPDVAFSALKEFNEQVDDSEIKGNKSSNCQSLDDIFWKILRERCELCHRALRIRHDRLCKQVSDVAPILWQHGALARLGKGESIKELLYHGYSTISLGYAGLYECVKAITGESLTGKIGKQFGLQVMKFLNSRCMEWKAAEDIDYSVYGTPIEATTYKLAKNLKRRFGEDVFIKLDNHNRNFITNSYHVPVWEQIDPFTKLSIEAEFQALSPGGAISYVECADLTKNIDIVLSVINHIYNTIIYAELNTTTSYCHKCEQEGMIGIVDKDNKLKFRCNNCGNDDQEAMNVSLRLCGYIGNSINGINQGRMNDIRDRFIHVDNHDEVNYVNSSQ